MIKKTTNDMKNKINIAELLKDCPKGMELDCLTYEDVYFDYVDDCNIIHCYIQHETHKTYITFNQHGTPNSDIKSKCVIFPKGETTWEGFVPPCKFKTGDVLFVDCSDDEDKSYQYIFILNDPEFYGKWHSYCHLDGVGCFHSEETYLTDEEYHPRFATEDEKAKLFDVIKENGYKWNPETKTLEKLIEPKFKDGDRVVKKGDISTPVSIVRVGDKYYYHYSNTEGTIGLLPISEQDDWELVPTKFDINTLKPFDKVLVRDNNEQFWTCDWFSFHDTKQVYPFACVGHYVSQCIPYEGNQHLLGTTNDCDEFYKNWE